MQPSHTSSELAHRTAVGRGGYDDIGVGGRATVIFFDHKSVVRCGLDLLADWGIFLCENHNWDVSDLIQSSGRNPFLGHGSGLLSFFLLFFPSSRRRRRRVVMLHATFHAVSIVLHNNGCFCRADYLAYSPGSVLVPAMLCLTQRHAGAGTMAWSRPVGETFCQHHVTRLRVPEDIAIHGWELGGSWAQGDRQTVHTLSYACQ